MYAFNNQTYLEQQKKAFTERIGNCTKLYVEVGGKLIEDKHATRVLPGYDENQKLNFIKELFNDDFELIYTISAENIINTKIREDFASSYLDETFRLISEFEKYGILVNNIVISKFKIGTNSKILNEFVKKLNNLNKNVFYLNYNNNYLPSNEFLNELDKQPLLKLNKKNIVTTGPGGGSGKFAFCLAQLYNEMKNGEVPQYIKYESFPVHNLSITHPLNLAYVAATADLKDVILEDKYHSGSISYNRDLDNYELLKFVSGKFDRAGQFLNKLTSPTEMGINFIRDGIVDDNKVQEASILEILRRFLKHKNNFLKGKENKDCSDRIKELLLFAMNNYK